MQQDTDLSKVEKMNWVLAGTNIRIEEAGMDEHDYMVIDRNDAKIFLRYDFITRLFTVEMDSMTLDPYEPDTFLDTVHEYKRYARTLSDIAQN